MQKLVKTIVLFAACLTIHFGTSPAIGKSAAGAEKGTLHRLDFRIEGASCVTCLRRIGQTFRTCPGVLKADVSIYRPFWAIVIYDAKSTNFNKLSDAIKSEHVKLVEVEDKHILAVPAIIVPKDLSGS